MSIVDPSTLASDWLLAGVTVWFAWNLALEVRRVQDRAMLLWLGAFLGVAMSALLGGIGHGFGPDMSPEMASLLATNTLVFAGGASLLFLLSILHLFTAGRVRGVLAAVAVAKFALFAFWVALNDDAKLVIYDGTLTMLVIVVLCAWGAWSQDLVSASWILIGVVLSLLAALILQGRVSFHPHFNNTDLHRVIQAAAMYFLYRGGLLMRTLEPAGRDLDETQPLPLARDE